MARALMAEDFVFSVCHTRSGFHISRMQRTPALYHTYIPAIIDLSSLFPPARFRFESAALSLALYTAYAVPNIPLEIITFFPHLNLITLSNAHFPRHFRVFFSSALSQSPDFEGSRQQCLYNFP